MSTYNIPEAVQVSAEIAYLEAHFKSNGDHIRATRAALEAASHLLMAEAWEQGATAGWKQSGEGWNAEYPDESTGECSVDLTVNPYKQHGNG
jgi:hypothetical protein